MIGRLVKRRREAQGLTQTELAARAGIPQAYISQIEAGKARLPRDYTLDALGGALGLTREEFYAAAGPETPAAPDPEEEALADVYAWLRRQPDLVADFAEARRTMTPRVYREFVKQTATAWASNARMQMRTWELARRPAPPPADPDPEDDREAVAG